MPFPIFIIVEIGGVSSMADQRKKAHFEISGDAPNEETIEAIKEAKRMKANPSLGKTYSDVDQMMEELLADV